MILGFTGTRGAVTSVQGDMALEFIQALTIDEAHHGDCVGADAWFHRAIRMLHVGARIVSHPPTVEVLRARCDADLIWSPKPYILRNHDIVAMCDRLLAMPATMDEAQRSGTWSTVRYARLCGKLVTLALPDGSIRHEANER